MREQGCVFKEVWIVCGVAAVLSGEGTTVPKAAFYVGSSSAVPQDRRQQGEHLPPVQHWNSCHFRAAQFRRLQGVTQIEAN